MCYNININADGLKRESDCIMKKVALLILCFTILICLVACNQGQNQTPTPEHTHSFGEWSVTKNPTCTEDGIKARYCDCGEKQSDTIPALNHTTVIDEAVAPTCTTAGKTEGKHCATCDTLLVKQETVPTLPHTYGEWITIKVANCGQDGEIARYCTCGAKQTEVIYGTGMHSEVIDPAVAPTCTETGLTEGKHCSVCDKVILAQQIVDAKGHVLANGKCENCDYRYSVGLEYTSNGDGTCYVSGIGTCIDTDIVIPEISPDGDIVTTIGYNAFYECSDLISVVIADGVTTIGDQAFAWCTNLISVVIPDSVTTIGEHAFARCTNLSSVVIGDSVATIGEFAFTACESLTSIVIPDTVTTIGNGAFYECDSLGSVVIGDSVTIIGSSAFYHCDSLISVVIGDSVTTIGESAFSCCYNLTSIVIPDSVTSIGGHAFSSCSLKNVYYTGSETEWQAITIGSSNSSLTNATKHYNYVPENN